MPLAQLQRVGPTGKATSELRVTAGELAGHRFAHLRVWYLSARTGRWVPDPKRGCTIRAREIGEVIAALEVARGRLLADHGRTNLDADDRGAA